MPASSSPFVVHKFGGAAAADADGIRRIGALMQERHHQATVVVVSAMGKTTAALERALRQAWAGQAASAEGECKTVEDAHWTAARTLGLHQKPDLARRWTEWFVDLRESLARPGEDFDRFYDRTVQYGELLSTSLVAAHMTQIGLATRWHDARDLIQTDGNHREARPNMTLSRQAIRAAMQQDRESIHVVPGFIGRSQEGHPVTLGLEGSDYSAAVLAHALAASSVTLWKNVAGVYQADPALFPDAQRLPFLDYQEVFQMANYGAKVIHPKTLQPLEESGISLHVRSFLDPGAAGTDIGSAIPPKGYPPIRVRVDGLTLLTLRHNDLAYLTERDIARIFSLLREHRAKALLTEIGLMILSVAVRIDPLRWKALQKDLEQAYRLRFNAGMHLLTIRHYGNEAVTDPPGAALFLEQRSRLTLQRLYAPNPSDKA
jgi:aspartate kinase